MDSGDIDDLEEKAHSLALGANRVYHFGPTFAARRRLGPMAHALASIADLLWESFWLLEQVHGSLCDKRGDSEAKPDTLKYAAQQQPNNLSEKKPMADLDLAVLINRYYQMTFVSGEDRTFSVVLIDKFDSSPVDLTTSAITFAIPREGGGSIKRRNTAIKIPCSTAVALGGATVFTYASHGLVTGENVTFAATADGSALPTELSSSVTYQALVIDDNTFSLTNAGANVVFGSRYQSVLLMTTYGITMTNAALGKLSLSMPNPVTSAASSGQGQSYQLSLTNAQNLTRIQIGNNLLDVFEQPCP